MYKDVFAILNPWDNIHKTFEKYVKSRQKDVFHKFSMQHAAI